MALIELTNLEESVMALIVSFLIFLFCALHFFTLNRVIQKFEIKKNAPICFSHLFQGSSQSPTQRIILKSQFCQIKRKKRKKRERERYRRRRRKRRRKKPCLHTRSPRPRPTIPHQL